MTVHRLKPFKPLRPADAVDHRLGIMEFDIYEIRCLSHAAQTLNDEADHSELLTETITTLNRISRERIEALHTKFHAET